MALRSISANNGTGATASVAVPSGAAAGDTVIVVVASDNQLSTPTAPTGFTSLDSIGAYGPDGGSAQIAYKQLTGADTGSYSSTVSSAAWEMTAYCFSERDGTNPPVVGFQALNSAGSASPVTVANNGVTALARDDLLWIAVPDTASSTSTAVASFTPPTGYTADSIRQRQFAAVLGAYQENVPAGATGTVSGSFSTDTGNAGYVGWLVRIPSDSAWHHVNSAANFNNGSASSIAASLGTSTIHDTIIVAVSWDNTGSRTITSVADSVGSTYTQIGSTFLVTTDNQNIAYFYAKDVAGTGSNTVTVTLSGTAPDTRIAVDEYSGLDNTAPLVDHAVTQAGNATTSTDGATTPTATPTAAGQLVFGSGMDSHSNQTITAGTGFTKRAEDTDTLGSKVSNEDRAAPNTSPIDATWTLSAAATSTWCGLVAIFAEPSSGGGGATPPTFVSAGAIGSGTATFTPGAPAGVAVGDILILAVKTSNQALPTIPPTGGTETWTQFTNSPQSVGTAATTTGSRLYAFWARASTSSPTMPLISDSGNMQMARVTAWRGCVTSGDPSNVTSGGTEATADTSGSVPGATTTADGCTVVVLAAHALPDLSSTAVFSAETNADLASLTEHTDNSTTAGVGGALMCSSGELATAGAYGATTYTCSTASTKAFMTIALQGAVPVVAGSASLSAALSLTASANVAHVASASESATLSLSATGKVAHTGQASLGEALSMSASALVVKEGQASLSSSASLSASAKVAHTGVAALSSALSLTDSGKVAHAASASLSSSLSLSPTGKVAHTGQASESATLALTASAIVKHTGTADLAEVWTMSAAADVSGGTAVHGSASLAAALSLAASSRVNHTGSVAVGASLTLGATGHLTVGSGASLSASSTLAAQARVAYTGRAALSTTASVSAGAAVARTGAADLAVTFTLSARGRVLVPTGGIPIRLRTVAPVQLHIRTPERAVVLAPVADVKIRVRPVDPRDVAMYPEPPIKVRVRVA